MVEPEPGAEVLRDRTWGRKKGSVTVVTMVSMVSTSYLEGLGSCCPSLRPSVPTFPYSPQ